MQDQPISLHILH